MGDAEKVGEFLKNHSVDILRAKLSTEIVMRLNSSIQLNKKPHPESSQNGKHITKVKLILSPIHIAIIAKQDNIVKTISEYILKTAITKENVSKLKEVLGMKIEVKFQGDPEIYAFRDRVLDGVNAFHLAATFHAQSLPQIIKIIKQRDIVDDFQDLWQETDRQLGRTPLHLAAKVPNNFATW